MWFWQATQPYMNLQYTSYTVCHTGQQWHTHTLSCRTVTTRFSPESRLPETGGTKSCQQSDQVGRNVIGIRQMAPHEHTSINRLTTHELQPKPKMIWWVASCFAGHLRRAATKTHQQGGGKVHQALSTWLPAWLPLMVILSICSNFVHLQVCILISLPKPALRSHPHTTRENNIWNAQN